MKACRWVWLDPSQSETAATLAQQEVEASPGEAVILPLLPQLQVLDVIRKPGGTREGRTWMSGWVEERVDEWVGR